MPSTASPLPLQAQQRSHIATVMQVAGDGLAAPAAQRHDAIIRASWQRCVHQHRLDPTRMQEAIILPQGRLREHQDQMDALLHIARHGLEALYQQVAGMGYVVLLTDARGITVDFIGDLSLEPHLRKAGLYLGADWSEPVAGTCGVGTCLSTGQALTVHLDDHFDATHIPLTCTSAPVFGPAGELCAVLDISQLSSPLPKASQHLALQLVQVYAHHIENAAFLQRHRADWVLRLSAAPHFLDVNPDFLLALDSAGRITGHNRRAQLLLEPLLGGGVAGGVGRPSRLVGQPFERLFEATLADLGRFQAHRPAHQRALRLAGGRSTLYLLASPPPAPLRPRPASAASPADHLPAGPGAAALPVPLAALSGGDAALDRLLQRAARLMNAPVSLLVTGETGSGKEWFAKAVHRSSARGTGPFVAVNCAAIPEALIESELFGHLPGSFSGAGPKGKRGLVQEADGGTLFLDEIGDMPRSAQARLLRVLAEHEVLPVGATRPVAVDLRVIAATHCPLDTLVREGGFREDLYYRLNGAHFQLPPLRERQDLAWLAQRMLADAPAGQAVPALAAATAAALRAHHWPGNLRELRNAMDHARSLCQDGLVQTEDLPEALLRAAGAAATRLPALRQAAPGPRAPSPPPDDAAEALRAQLGAAHWNVSALARALGCSRMTLYRRMKRLGVVAPWQG
jgi:transcriptional regulator of acetoin/glycerol metabolism